MSDLLACAIHGGELARVGGSAAGLEANFEAVSTTNTKGDGKAALTVQKESLPGNIHLRNINRRRTIIEQGDLTGSGLPDRHSAKSDCARCYAERTRS